jgi:transposase
VISGGVDVDDPWGEKGHDSVQYSTRFKRTMIQKMAGPSGRSAWALAQETGVAQSTLSRWLRAAGSVGSMSDDNEQGKEQRRPQDWSAKEKLEVITEAERLSEQELGGFLRRKGLHEAQLKQWREEALAALGSRKAESQSKAEARRVRELERELKRKDKALAEAAALLVLQKKVQALWGDEDDDTDPKRGK